MSRDRQRRRAERERLAAARAVERARAEERARRRRRRAQSLRAVRSALPRRRATQGILVRRRRLENGVVAAVFVAVQALTWALSRAWEVRLGVLAVSVLVLPAVVTLALDRRR